MCMLVSSYLTSTHSRWRNRLGCEHTHLHTVSHVSITSQPRNPSLAHMHTYMLWHIWICLSVGLPQCLALGVDEIRFSPTQLWSCLTHLFVFTSPFFLLTCFAARFSFSSLCLNPGLANNKERLWLKLAIHQILFLSFSLCRNKRFYSTLVSFHPLVLSFSVSIHSVNYHPNHLAFIKVCLLKGPTDISYLHTWLYPAAAWKVESQHATAVSDKEGSEVKEKACRENRKREFYLSH